MSSIKINSNEANQKANLFKSKSNLGFRNDVFYSLRTVNMSTQESSINIINQVNSTYNQALEFVIRDGSKIKGLASTFDEIEKKLASDIKKGVGF